MNTVTVKKVTRRNADNVTLSFSKLPGQKFGPYPWKDAVTELTFSALLSRADARNLVLDALATGTATTEV